MARIINFYVPASYRKTIRKPTASTGLATVIPFPSAARQGYSYGVLSGRTERFGVGATLRNNGVLSLIAGN